MYTNIKTAVAMMVLMATGTVCAATPAVKNTTAMPQVLANGKSNDEIAKELSNPVAKLINMPFQLNWDYGGGPKDKGQHYYLQIQPVIPITINNDWNIISRSILLVENKHNFGYPAKTGLGDLSQTFFVSPGKNIAGNWLLGLGPVFLIPTATEKQLGAERWGMGPSILLGHQGKDWTIGVLASQTWSIGGGTDKNYVNKSFVQPFIARHLPDAWTVTLTSEYTYDWHENEDVFPLNLMVAKVVRFGKLPVSFSVGARYYVDKPSWGPDWGLRGMITFVLPE